MANDVLPDPDTPTTATVRHSGTSTSMSRRLLCRAPRTPMTAGRVPGTGIAAASIKATYWSRVDRSARPAVEAQRLHDLERGGVGELRDVGGGQHAGVLGDDGRGRALGDGVEMAFDPGPEVFPARYVVGHRVDRSQRLSRACLDVGDVLLMHQDVVTGGEPAEVPADEVLPREGQHDIRGRHVAGDVLAEVDVVDGHPAGVNDVDEHQGVMVREVD